MRGWHRLGGLLLVACLLSACGLADTEAQGNLDRSLRNPEQPVATTITAPPTSVPAPPPTDELVTAPPLTAPPVTTPPPPTTTTEPPHPPPGNGPDVEEYWVRWRTLARLRMLFRGTPVLPKLSPMCQSLADLGIAGNDLQRLQATGGDGPSLRSAFAKVVTIMGQLASQLPASLGAQVSAALPDASNTLAALPADAPAATVAAAIQGLESRQQATWFAVFGFSDTSCTQRNDYVDQAEGYRALGLTPQK